MKRITIDARLIDYSTGIYSQRLLHWLNKSHSKAYEFTVLVPSSSAKKWQAEYPNLEIRGCDVKSYSVSEQTKLIAALEACKPDIVHFTMPQQPFLWMRPSVTTIHDLTLVHYDNIDMNRLVYKMRKAVFVSLLRTIMARSKAIITPTNYVKADLVNYFGKQNEKKTFITHEAGDPIGTSPEPMNDFKGKPFIFTVGNAFPYKNIQLIIDAYSKLKVNNPDLLLLLAGKKNFFYEELEAYVKKKGVGGVHFLGFISDGEKRWCFQNAQCYVSASYSEGFNISLLEAMYEQCPAIISRASCHPEVGGNAALYFDPGSVDDLAKSISSLIASPKLRKDLIAKGNKRVKDFSWERMAEETVAVYRKAMKDGR